jgi:GNAT superfamily N-acetyltransferase
MDFSIRIAKPEDATSIALLLEQLGYSISAVETELNINTIYGSVNDEAYVAMDSDKVVGWIQVFCTIRLESKPFCEIAGLVIDEQYRGKGIGKLLIDHLKPWCREKRCDRLRVRCNAKRDDAHRFYKNAGFNEIKVQKVFEIDIV